MKPLLFLLVVVMVLSAVALPWNISGYTFDQPQLSNNFETLQAAAFEDKGLFPCSILVPIKLDR